MKVRLPDLLSQKQGFSGASLFPWIAFLQNIPEAAPKASPSFSLSVSEKLSRYGVNALNDVEHLGFLVRKETLAARLLAHFGSLKTLAKVSAVELRSFMTIRQAERLIGGTVILSQPNEELLNI
jgi:excinuclease UvrABC nuclease subunit